MTVISLARFYQVEQKTPPKTKTNKTCKMQVKSSNSTHFKTKMHGL